MKKFIVMLFAIKFLQGGCILKLKKFRFISFAFVFCLIVGCGASALPVISADSPSVSAPLTVSQTGEPVKFQGELLQRESRMGGGTLVIKITKILDDPRGLLNIGDSVEVVYRSGLPPGYQQDFEIDPDLEGGDSVEVFCTALDTIFELRDGNYVKKIADPSIITKPSFESRFSFDRSSLFTNKTSHKPSFESRFSFERSSLFTNNTSFHSDSVFD
jgi:hypothetical protein